MSKHQELQGWLVRVEVSTGAPTIVFHGQISSSPHCFANKITDNTDVVVQGPGREQIVLTQAIRNVLLMDLDFIPHTYIYSFKYLLSAGY